MSFLLSSTLPKVHKIHKSSIYEEVFGNGKRLNSNYFTVCYKANLLGFPRLGLVVSKKNFPAAVKRNRVKRILREVFRRNKELFASLDVVIIAKQGADRLSYDDAKLDIESMLVNMGHA